MVTVLDLLKTQLSILDASQDVALLAYIEQAKGLASNYLDWPIDQVSETFVKDSVDERVHVACGHIDAITAITIDGDTKVLSDYMLDTHNRLMTVGYDPITACRVVIEANRGWSAEPYPYWLSTALVLTAEAFYSASLTGGSFGASAGTSGVTSKEQVVGVRSVEYAVKPNDGTGRMQNVADSGLPLTAERLLSRHRCRCGI